MNLKTKSNNTFLPNTLRTKITQEWNHFPEEVALYSSVGVCVCVCLKEIIAYLNIKSS